jgi:hypothetical protein
VCVCVCVCVCGCVWQQLSPGVIAARFDEFAPNGTLTRSAFVDCVMSLLLPSVSAAKARALQRRRSQPQRAAAEEEEEEDMPASEVLMAQLNAMFQMVDLSHDGLVDRNEMLAGVYVFAQGSDLEKLGTSRHTRTSVRPTPCLCLFASLRCFAVLRCVV